jgi:ubiquinone/menaquinone biosynthesis C-methylase UbiE
MLIRILEKEVMDSDLESSEYDGMDHSAVNQQFAEDLLAVEPRLGDVLDLGTGTAQIPVAICQREPDCRIMAADSSASMLDLARYNLELGGVVNRIQLTQVDAKKLPFSDAMFDTVISNSLLHHLPVPKLALVEAMRVCKPGGRLFFRDLIRPETDELVQSLVATYAGDENEYQQQMFDDSLRAALTVEEVRALIHEMGFDPETVQQSSDRHWTWTAKKPEE